MALIRKHAPPAQVQVVRNRFDSWRKNKRGRERIPEPLWRAAVKLCERCSVHGVSRWLRLNSTALRHRLNGNHTLGHSNDKTPAFIEWVATSPAPIPPSAAEYVVELEGAQGPNVRIRMRAAHVAEVAELASLLRRERG